MKPCILNLTALFSVCLICSVGDITRVGNLMHTSKHSMFLALFFSYFEVESHSVAKASLELTL